jgi:hypothetical protein
MLKKLGKKISHILLDILCAHEVVSLEINTFLCYVIFTQGIFRKTLCAHREY